MVKGNTETVQEAKYRRQLKRAKKQTPETVQLSAEPNTSAAARGPLVGSASASAATNGKSKTKQQQQQQQKPAAPGVRRLAKEQQEKKPQNKKDAAAEDVQRQEEEKEDQTPDMVGDVSFRRTMTDKRQTNIQKLLVVGSRSMNHKERHLLNDLAGLMAHGRPHSKLETRNDVGTQLQQLCELHNCNGSVFLESRKGDTSYLWFAQAPNGPSMKMQIFNVHTADELRMVGNCLKYSRPLLHFDNEFETVPHLRIARALLTSAFNVPRFHPRSKPFVDHILCFFVLEGKIYFRHYQILEGPAASAAASAATTSIASSGAGMGGMVGGTAGRFGLTEIGPRFVLDPQVLLQGCVRGQVVWKSSSAISPTEIRRGRKHRALAKQQFNEQVEQKAVVHREKLPGPGQDPLEGIFHRGN